jgi:hypothetical protein
MASDSEEEREWKYSIEDVGDDAEEEGRDREDELDDEGEEDRVEIDRSVEPGSPSLEHALFVALGALLAIATIARGLGLL